MTCNVTIRDNGVTVKQTIEAASLKSACKTMRLQMIDAESICEGNEGVEMRARWTEQIMAGHASCSLRGDYQDGQSWARVTIEPASLTGWSAGDGSGHEGYNVTDFFGADGAYLGPDEHGIEPIFAAA